MSGKSKGAWGYSLERTHGVDKVEDGEEKWETLTRHGQTHQVGDTGRSQGPGGLTFQNREKKGSFIWTYSFSTHFAGRRGYNDWWSDGRGGMRVGWTQNGGSTIPGPAATKKTTKKKQIYTMAQVSPRRIPSKKHAGSGFRGHEDIFEGRRSTSSLDLKKYAADLPLTGTIQNQTNIKSRDEGV